MKKVVRALSTATMRLVLRVFFRRIEIAGGEHILPEGPVLFVLNHPNGLVDSLFLLCFAPRAVSFLAKEPLFRMPVVGFFVRVFGSIPVYRRQDPGSDVSRNRETFEEARALLSRGGVLALFPEGASHDESKLLGLKTGAARIALGVASKNAGMEETETAERLRIVPAGLYYTWKIRFRSSALLSFGEPFFVAPVALDERGEPPREATRELTGRIEAALSKMTLQAESREALDLVRRAERIFSIEPEGSPMPLAEELDLRRRFVEGARRLRQRDPSRFAAIEARIARFESERKEAGLPLGDLTPESLSALSLPRLVAGNVGSLQLLPVAALGVFLHYPAYRLAGFLADQFARGQEDQLATIKAGAAVLLFPATWAACAAAAGMLLRPGAALVTAVLAPVSGYAALRASESLDVLVGRGRALLSVFSRDSAGRRLLAERRALREEILEIASELDLLPS
jgi:glycerol-3-phosphate O-acyltransferase/dihydroxyacetone phosphate acyltransferase